MKRQMVALGIGLVACSSSSSPATSAPVDAGVVETSTAALPMGVRIVSGSSTPTSALAGDALALSVVYVMADGTTTPLSSEAAVSWVAPPTVVALDPTSTSASPLPSPGAAPTAIFIDNPGRPDRSADLAGVLFFLDPGTTAGGSVTVERDRIGGPVRGDGDGDDLRRRLPAGDATRSAAGSTARVGWCARCHGAMAEGSPSDDDAGMSFMIAGGDYSYPAPGLDAEPGNPQRSGLERRAPGRGFARRRRQRRPHAPSADGRLARHGEPRDGAGAHHPRFRGHLRIFADAERALNGEEKDG